MASKNGFHPKLHTKKLNNLKDKKKFKEGKKKKGRRDTPSFPGTCERNMTKINTNGS